MRTMSVLRLLLYMFLIVMISANNLDHERRQLSGTFTEAELKLWDLTQKYFPASDVANTFAVIQKAAYDAGETSFTQAFKLVVNGSTPSWLPNIPEPYHSRLKSLTVDWTQLKDEIIKNGSSEPAVSGTIGPSMTPHPTISGSLNPTHTTTGVQVSHTSSKSARYMLEPVTWGALWIVLIMLVL
ncbi:hypothetical protein F5882DRAFT_62138 [Hyaloscypha sp. PMI_1271]|nr:hypothetical protein F5882DRAFT_62138 [Hyaloscypha sp. PMI_1271]